MSQEYMSQMTILNGKSRKAMNLDFFFSFSFFSPHAVIFLVGSMRWATVYSQLCFSCFQKQPGSVLSAAVLQGTCNLGNLQSRERDREVNKSL